MLNLQELRARLAAQNKAERDESLKRARANFEKRKDIQSILKIIAALDVAELKEGKYTNGYRIIPGFGWTVYADLDVDGFLESHDKRLADLLAAISAVWTDREWDSSDYPANKTRTYSIWKEENLVQITAKLKDDSQKCRRVVVGKKTEERDVFQFVCDGEEVAS